MHLLWPQEVDRLRARIADLESQARAPPQHQVQQPNINLPPITPNIIVNVPGVGGNGPTVHNGSTGSTGMGLPEATAARSLQLDGPVGSALPPAAPAAPPLSDEERAFMQQQVGGRVESGKVVAWGAED